MDCTFIVAGLAVWLTGAAEGAPVELEGPIAITSGGRPIDTDFPKFLLVPDDLYEAADIDGCGFIKKFWYITVPTIKGLIIIQFIGAFIGASQSTGFILVMTYGGPDDATRVAGLHIFDNAYIMLRFGTAVTMAWLLGVSMMGFTTLQLKRLSRMEFRTADTAKKSM